MSPMMHDENFELRLSFAQKVYSIITLELLLTIVVASFLFFVPPVANFFNNFDYVLCILGWFGFILLQFCHQDYFFLLISTVSVALFIGPVCLLFSGKIILEAVKLTTAVVISLSLYTFWTTKTNRNFNYLGLFLKGIFLNGSIFVAILLILIKIWFPSGNLLTMIYGWLVSITCYGYIVYNTDNLVKIFNYANYISVSFYLYFQVMTIFLFVLYYFRWCGRVN